MKKVFSIATFVLIILTTLSSCKKCGYCEVNGNKIGPYCDDDYDAAKESCANNNGTWTND